jgi:hypothetical protein
LCRRRYGNGSRFVLAEGEAVSGADDLALGVEVAEEFAEGGVADVEGIAQCVAAEGPSGRGQGGEDALGKTAALRVVVGFGRGDEAEVRSGRWPARASGGGGRRGAR